jgi:hypothetical protein
MLVSDSFFTGRENLAIRVIATSAGSDPDIFISKVREQTIKIHVLIIFTTNPFKLRFYLNLYLYLDKSAAF